MADRYSAARLTPVFLAAALGLAGCEAPAPSASAPAIRAAGATSASETQLRRQATALQRTILEGALAGAAVGAGFDLTLGRDGDSPFRGLQIGMATGLAAGTYVAHIQRRYLRRERRLEAIRADLDKNATEIQTTINVMRAVLAVQRAELAEIKRRAATGQASPTDIASELSDANANLAQMQKAIDGASNRQTEFGQVRGLTLVSGGGAAIDPELLALSAQITTMKSIAGDLADEL